MKIMTEDYYSNCLIEAAKAKIKNHSCELVVIPPWESNPPCMHVMWSDGNDDYDFGIERPIGMLAAWTIHKGHIRKHRAGTARKFKRMADYRTRKRLANWLRNL